jgi:hypothetical protein
MAATKATSTPIVNREAIASRAFMDLPPPERWEA